MPRDMYAARPCLRAAYSKSLQLTNADNFHQVMVACIVLRQQNQMVHAAIILFQMRALGQVNLAA